MDLGTTRRSFLEGAAASFGLALISSLTPDLVARASAYAAEGKPFRFLAPQQAADFEAFSAQIIPTDGTPGAREAGAVYFVDYILAEVNPEQQGDFRSAMTALGDQVAEISPGNTSFAGLTNEQQMTVLRSMETPDTKHEQNPNHRRAGMARADAFNLLRAAVILGTFSDPSMGGNRFKIGWKLINFDDQAYWAPPFGHYDAEAKEKA